MFRYNMINKNNTEMKSEVAKGEILYKLYIGDFIYKSGISPIIGANGVSWIEITFNGVKGWIDMSRLANATKH
ncbi:hypothetical protein, partial [uncultured Clostridium sp.]|uniref:hypothetical protein n=1 Tax=uncultured Clostridium sp. TaxID=59620 RepID=UPI00262C5EE2